MNENQTKTIIGEWFSRKRFRSENGLVQDPGGKDNRISAYVKNADVNDVEKTLAVPFSCMQATDERSAGLLPVSLRALSALEGGEQ